MIHIDAQQDAQAFGSPLDSDSWGAGWAAESVVVDAFHESMRAASEGPEAETVTSPLPV